MVGVRCRRRWGAADHVVGGAEFAPRREGQSCATTICVPGQHSMPGLHGGHDRLQSRGVVRVAGEHLVGSPRRTHIWYVELPRVCCTWIARCTIGRRSVKLFRLGRKEDARPCIDIAQSRSATSRGQDKNSFGGTRANRWTQQKSGARISFKARRLVTPAGWIFHNAHRVFARQRWHLCPRSEQGPSTRLLSVIKIGLETGCTGNVQPAAARLVSGGPGIPACD
jgi:hypothetical protein